MVAWVKKRSDKKRFSNSPACWVAPWEIRFTKAEELSKIRRFLSGRDGEDDALLEECKDTERSEANQDQPRSKPGSAIPRRCKRPNLNLL